MRNFKKIIILVILFTFLTSMTSFGLVVQEQEEPSFFEEMLIGALKFIPNLFADIIRSFGVDTNSVYLPGSQFLFAFNTDNIFGAFTSKAYPIFKSIAIIMVSPTLGMVALSIITSKDGQGRLEAYNKFKVLTIAVIAMWFLPDLVNRVFMVRDELAIGMSNFFGGGEGVSFLDEMAKFAYEGDLFDAFIYLAATLFTMWLMFNYIGLSFGFAVLFLYTPIALIVTPARFGKQTFGEIMRDFVGFTMTPLLDITLLGIVATTRSVVPNISESGSVLHNLISIGLIMMVIPTRSALKQKLGFGKAMGDSLGGGLAMGAMAMMMRGSRKGKSASGGTQEHNETSSEQLQEEEKYYNDLEEKGFGNQKGTSPISNVGTSTSEAHESLDDIDFMDTERGQFAKDNYGKSHFNEADIGGLSNKERASVLGAKAAEQAQNEQKDKYKQQFKSGASKFGSIYGGALGASAGMFMGGKTMAMGGYAGSKAGKWTADKMSSPGANVYSTARNGIDKAKNGIDNGSRRVVAGMAWNRQNKGNNSVDLNMNSSDAQMDVDFDSVDFGDNFNQDYALGAYETQYGVNPEVEADALGEYQVSANLEGMKGDAKVQFKQGLGVEYDKLRERVKSNHQSAMKNNPFDRSVHEKYGKKLGEIDTSEMKANSDFVSRIDEKIETLRQERIEEVKEISKEKIEDFQKSVKEEATNILNEVATEVIEEVLHDSEVATEVI